MEIELKGDFNHGTGAKIKFGLSVLIFSEENTTIIFCPALDLNGYGSNENEALDSFKTTIQEYFNYALNKKTLVKDLISHGWKLKKNKLKEYKKINVPVEIPELV